MVDISAIGAYLPQRRLSCSSIVEANAWIAAGRIDVGGAEKAICAWDEDSITLAVDAARDCRDCIALDDSESIRNLFYCSTSAPFSDRLNAGIVAEALSLGSAHCADVSGSQRIATSAIINVAKMSSETSSYSLVVASEKQRVRSNSPRELYAGDGSAAVLLSDNQGIATLTAYSSYTTDFVDSFRSSQANYSRSWEERWIREEGYHDVMVSCVQSTLERERLSVSDCKYLCLPGPTRKHAQAVARRLGGVGDNVIVTLHDAFGDTGSSYPLLLLARALELADPDDRILVVGFGQGCDVLIFQAREKISQERPRCISRMMSRRKSDNNYLRYLTLNNQVDVDLGMRSEGDRSTSLSMLYRNRRMLYGLIGGKCNICGTAQFPKSRVCVNPSCLAVGAQEDEKFSDLTAKIITWCRDSLAFAYSPPLCYGILDFSSGGRIMTEFTDVDDVELLIGKEMRMVFRILDYDWERRFPKYFWKATPV